MAREETKRLWMPYAQAARLYLGVSPDLLRAAINAHELPAYEKPIVRGRKEGATRENHSYFVFLPEVDEYIRAHWPQPSRI